MKFLVKKIKSKEGELHFKRWRILDIPYFKIYIHGIYKADEDADLHNHPWNFLSMVLKGGYDVEQYTDTLEWDGKNKNGKFYQGATETKHRGFLNIQWNSKMVFHKVVKLDKPTYTLNFMFGKKTEWGFNTKQGFFDNISYRKRKHSK